VSLIKTVRGKGLFNAVEINDSPDSSTAWELCVQLKENGLLAKPTHGNIIRFAPPLVMTEDQLLECSAIIRKTFLEFERIKKGYLHIHKLSKFQYLKYHCIT
jgi:ornithine--oxo-acid transaminase